MTRNRVKETTEQYEERLNREHAEQAEARLDETMKRRDIIEAIDIVLWRLAQDNNNDHNLILDMLKEAFE